MSDEQVSSVTEITAQMSDRDLSQALDDLSPAPERPAVEPGTFASDKIGLEEAASELSETRAPRSDVVERAYQDPEDWSKPAPDSLTVTAEEAADALKSTRDWERQVAQGEVDAVLQARVDNFRTGEPQPQQQPEQLQPQAEHAPQPETELDRLLQPLPAEHRQPFVQSYNELLQRTQREAQQHYAAAQAQYTQVLQQSQAALAQTIAVAEGLALAPFSELHGVPANELPAIVNQLQRQNPQRYAQLAQHVAVVRDLAGKQLQQAAAAQQQQAQQQQAERQRHWEAFDKMAAVHDAAADKLLAQETPAMQAEIKLEAIKLLTEDGMSEETLRHEWNTSLLLRSFTAQKMIIREAKARIAARNVRAARQNPIPQVQRPGASEEARDYSEVSSLQRDFNLKPTAKNAAALLTARRARAR
jgi:hypothetical protein